MLADQAISKLLGFQNVPVQNDNEALSFPPHSTSQKKDGPSGKHVTKTTIGKVFIVIAWTLLALIVWVVVANVGFQVKLPLGLEAIKRTHGYLFHIGILAIAAYVLGLTTWLYSKNRLGKITLVVVIIGTILSVSLPLLTIRSGIGAKGIGRLRAVFSPPSPAPVTAVLMDTTVNGILYSEDNPSALVGHQVIHEGDSIEGVSVIKIDKHKVEFEKNGRRWTQAVGGPPDTDWK